MTIGGALIGHLKKLETYSEVSLAVLIDAVVRVPNNVVPLEVMVQQFVDALKMSQKGMYDEDIDITVTVNGTTIIGQDYYKNPPYPNPNVKKN
jgi:hypothetical protein